jgi:hypothetical protein
MEHRLLIIFALLLSLSLLGRTASAANVIPATSATSPLALSETLLLAAGTLQLEGTAQAIDATQAQELAFLWQAYGVLATQDATAATELAALLDQIQTAMTPDQLRAVEAMQLDQVAVQSLAAELGLETEASGQANSAASQTSAQAGLMPPDTGGAAPALDGNNMAGPGLAVGASSTGSLQPGQSRDVLLTSLVQALVTVLQARI